MELLKFTIEENAIAEILGRQFYSTQESAVFELIKNSFDAGATYCNIYIEKENIKIVDNGKGLDYEDVKENWMHIGKSNKGYLNEDNNRIYAGSKGVGRFALARLGDVIELKSKKKDKKAIVWYTDWQNSNLDQYENFEFEGTTIDIRLLREDWKIKEIKKLENFLNRAYNSSDMTINIYFEDKKIVINPIFEDLNIGVNYASKITLNYNHESMELNVQVASDEFMEEVNSIVAPISPKEFNETYKMIEELDIQKDNSLNYFKDLGSFNAELYFAQDRTPSSVIETFKYKHKLFDKPEIGVILYRNSFSISSLEGRKDWLNITNRAVKSPAAATHPTGSWRVRVNQIFGSVTIDKRDNKNLKDLSNRQGLDENDYYELFREIILFGLSRFEKYRQSIIRNIDKYNKSLNVKKKEEKKLKEFLKSPKKVMKMTEEEISDIAQEIIEITNEYKKQSKEQIETEQQYKYDVRILNSLATQGLRASAIAHELHNRRNFLETAYSFIEEALIKYGFWDELNSPELTRFSYENVPKLLADLESVNRKLISFIDVILKKIEKEKFKKQSSSIEGILDNTIKLWREQYNWVNFDLNINSNVPEEVNVTQDVIEVIFDNLILNSIQNNEEKEKLEISIKVYKREGYLEFNYRDDGRGLNEKYKKNPFRILDVHETSRNDGHGLGMWIINNSLNMFKGEVLNINGDNGFEIYFKLRG